MDYGLYSVPTLTKLLLPFDNDDNGRKEKKSFLCAHMLLYVSTFNFDKKGLGSKNSIVRL